MEEKQHPFPSPLYIGIIIFLGFIFSLASAGFLSIVATNAFPQIKTNTQAQRVLAKLIITLGELNLFLFTVLFLYRKTDSLPRLFRLNFVPSRFLVLMIPLGFTLAIAGDALDRLLQLILPSTEITGQLAEMLKSSSIPELSLLILGSVVVAPVVEEFLFRGALQQAFEKTIGVTKAVIYSSLLWAIIHGIMNWAIQIFVLGVIIGYIAWRLNSTIPSMILHAINNLVAVIFYNWDIQHILPAYEWQNQVNPIYTILSVGFIVWSIRWLDATYRSATSFTEES